MLEKIHTIEGAEYWFLSHSHGSVLAVNSAGKEKECFDFPTAVHWIKGDDNLYGRHI